MLPRSVLLVDDNCDDVFLTSRVLRKIGITEIRIASDGQEALDILLNSAEPLPELLILDLRMPKISGQQVLAEIRRARRTIALPVLALSSSDDPRDRDICLQYGVIGFLNKPLELPLFTALFEPGR
jgi:CheY-like chemotaxis protein